MASLKIASVRRPLTRRPRRRLRMPVVVVATFMAAMLGWPSTATASTSTVPAPNSTFGSDWGTYHGDAEATGVGAANTKILPSRKAWTSPVLDG
jgi:hypothetical protein